jgi:hypothetical protein
MVVLKRPDRVGLAMEEASGSHNPGPSTIVVDRDRLFKPMPNEWAGE